MEGSGMPQVLMLPGPRIRQEEVEQVRQLIYAELEKSGSLVLDMGAVEFVESAFLGLLIRALKHATSRGGNLHLCAVQKPVANILALMRLNRVFEIFETAEAARAEGIRGKSAG